MSLPVWLVARAASDYRSSSLLTAVSGAGNMQINGVKGQSALIVSVCKPSQLLFKATLESLNFSSLMFSMWRTLNSSVQVSPNYFSRCTNRQSHIAGGQLFTVYLYIYSVLSILPKNSSTATPFPHHVSLVESLLVTDRL